MDEGYKITYNHCQGIGCHERCPLKTYTKDGKIIRTERTILKGHDAERYMICQRGALAGKFPYLKERILHPLKRVGERGEGKFEQISWDQAFTEIDAKINELTEMYGPRTVIMNTFLCGIPNNYNGSPTISLTRRFIHTYDCTMLEWPGVDQASNYPVNIDYGNFISYMNCNTSVWREEQPEVLLVWGGAPIGWSRAAGTTRLLVDLQQAGTKLIDVGVIFDACAAKCDQFIAVKSGTDAALALAMVNVMIQEKRYDVQFLSERTVAPFLVRADNGLFLREKDIEGNDSPNYVCVDETGALMYVPRGQYSFEGAQPDLLGRYELNGVPCETVFCKLKASVAQWTPESQEKVTGVPAQVCLDFIHVYLDHTPKSAIFFNYGIRLKGAGMAGRAVNLLAVLSGNMKTKAGRINFAAQGHGFAPPLNDLALYCPDGMASALQKGVKTSIDDILASFEDPNYEGQKYTVLLNPYSNPVQNWPNRELWAKRFLPKLELIVVGEIRMTDTVMFADYVLPSATIFEREEIISGLGDCIILNEPAIEPMGETMDPTQIWRGLTRGLSNAAYFDHDADYWLRLRLETGDPAFTSIEPKVTLERLREEKIIRFNVPDIAFEDCWATLEFGTASGKIEFYREEMADIDCALAKYMEPQWIEQREKAKKYPLQYYPGRHRFYMQSQFTEIPELRIIGGKQSTVGLNPATAAERGIREGDDCEVFNEKGAVKVKAHLSQMFPEGMAHVWYAYDSRYYPTDPPTALSSALSTAETKDAFSRRFGVLVDAPFKGVMPPTLTMPVAAAHETFWDDLVDVRKCEGGN